MADFECDYFNKHFPRLTLEEQRDAVNRLAPERQRALLQGLSPEVQGEVLRTPLEQRLAGLSEEEIQQYFDRIRDGRSAPPRKTRRKK